MALPFNAFSATSPIAVSPGLEEWGFGTLHLSRLIRWTRISIRPRSWSRSADAVVSVDSSGLELVWSLKTLRGLMFNLLISNLAKVK